MEEFQEAEILWPESIPNPESLVDWSNVLHFTPSPNKASLSSSSSSSNSTCTQDELQEFQHLRPGLAKYSYVFSGANSPKEFRSDEEWQEAEVLWPDDGSLDCNEFTSELEDSDGEDDHPTEGEPTKLSSPIDIPKPNRNLSVHLL